MKHLVQKMKEIEKRDFDVVLSRGTLALHQTQRNKAKTELIQALYIDLKEALETEGFTVYETAYGPVVELLNKNVENKMFRMMKEDEKDLYTGFMSIHFDAIMKNLDTNGELDQEDFYHEQEQKRIREAEKEKLRLQKIERDAELRAEKARLREVEIMRLEGIKDDKEE